MKKIVILLLLTASLFFFAGCSPVGTSQNTSYSFIGTIANNGRSWVIVTDDSKTYKISTTFLDLNPYIGKKIKVHGQFSKDVFFIDDVKITQ